MRKLCEQLPPSYWLVIAEKTKAAQKIAEALASGRPLRCRTRWGTPFWIVLWRGRHLVIAPAAGHLFGLCTDEQGYPVFSYRWCPLWEAEKDSKYTQKFYKSIETLSRKASIVINACDYDVEGSVIGYNIIRFIVKQSKPYRVKFSSLTSSELRNSFSKLTELDWNMIEAGLARHELDWLWGINLSRALMAAIKRASGKRVILSAGRVQTPTLVEVLQRDLERKLFTPLPIFNLNIEFLLGKSRHRAKVASYSSKEEAEKVLAILKTQKYLAVEDVRVKSVEIKPPTPFNLGDLQAEASRIFGYSPEYTQKIAEELYLDGLISYPRTNSQKLPGTLDIRGILYRLSTMRRYRPLINYVLSKKKDHLKPRNGVKDDPAHPAIYPTGEVPKAPLSKPHARIFDLVVKRFLATLSSAAHVMVREITLVNKASAIELVLTEKKVVDRGWLYVYDYVHVEEKLLPPLTKGQKVPIIKTWLHTSYTRQPPKVTKIKIVKWMESVGIGTEATRARILNTLFQRKYLTTNSLGVTVTDLGYAVVEVVKSYFPRIASVELTRQMEEELRRIQLGVERRQAVVNRAKTLLRDMLKNFEENYLDRAGVVFAKSIGLIKPSEECLVCGRESIENRLCSFHSLGLKQLEDSYLEWVRRGVNVSFREYVKKIASSRSAGVFVKEVAQAMLKGVLPFKDER